MSITLYTKTSLGGVARTYTNDVPNFCCIRPCARSLKVERCPWVAFTERDYKGEFKIYGFHEYMDLKDFDMKIRSLRVIKEALENPTIIVYAEVNYPSEGAKKELSEKTETLATIEKEMGGKISSHIIERGPWILYEKQNFEGHRMFTKENVRDYSKLEWKVSSLRPLTQSDFEST
uniref:Epidermal differentiation-specific protein n=1 Tax=Callorhinchus milii TaxID=7868 RepID=V9L7Z9_CALMI